MKKPELLAPAGNYECLIAAIQGGADAVYLAGKHYGARNYAGNFSDEELIEGIKYAHKYGVKIYVTINTLIYDSEVKSFIEYVRFLASNNVDGVIVQDLGMMHLITSMFPNLEVHASTQMHIHNLEGLKLLKKLGIKRAVIARETPINEIKKMVKLGIDIEVFIQGALCVCYSGQCLMSSLIGGRSGNRGTCAQCCRQPYSLISDGKTIVKDKYLLSTKDLNTLDNIGKIIEAGVASLKIEGRMKRAEYVYYVTSLYRKAIDSYIKDKKVTITDEEIKNLKKLFNRGFTKGFIFNENNNNFTNEERPNHMGIEIGKVISYKNGKAKIKLTDELAINDGIRILGYNDVGAIVTNMFKDYERVKLASKGDIVSIVIDPVKPDSLVLKTTDNNQLEGIKSLIKSNTRKVSIKGNLTFKDNKLFLSLTDGTNTVTSSSIDIERSINQPTTQERVYMQLSKLGDTIYEFERLDIDIPNNLFIPISVINELRRQAVIELDEKRMYTIPFAEKEYKLKVPSFKKDEKFTIYIQSLDDYQKVKNQDCDEIYMDLDLYNTIDDERKILKLPRVINNYTNYDSTLLVGEVGSINKYKNIYTDFSLNVTNAYTVGLLHHLGVKKVTLSYEMNDYQINKLIDNYHNIYNENPNLELIVEANPEVMVSKFNLLTKYNLNNKDTYLVDRFKNKYKIVSKDNLMYIYNFERIKKDNYQNYYEMGINSLRINL